ncbi:MAG TPA: FHA domain-containing protein, partial [Kofleriaceae bacterium]|nr:FHA domain-containing protein [Kofleriaceae bacterium]
MCPVCRARPAEVGVLCDECRDELASPLRIMPEQLQLHVETPTSAALVDLWGRPHLLDPRTRIGRQVEGRGLAILAPSVSRHHAELTRGDGGGWTLRDLGSANGTYLDDRLVEGAVPIQEGDRVRFGHIAFYFVEDVSRLPPPRPGRTATATINPAWATLPPAELAPPPPVPQRAPEPEEQADADHPHVGLPGMTFKL